MVAVLITGMSGTGKSSVISAIAERGFDAVDTDYGGYTELVTVEGQVEPEPVWREARLAALLDRRRDGPLFVSGTVINQDSFYSRFDAVVLLSAPPDVVIARVGSRTIDAFGQRSEEQRKIVEDMRVFEPLLRADATSEIDTRASLDEVVERVLALAGGG